MSHDIINSLWLETPEDIIHFMNSWLSNDEFLQIWKAVSFSSQADNYLYQIDNDIYLAFIVWLIIVKYSELKKDIYPFVRHLDRVLWWLDLTKEQFGITRDRIEYFLIPNQEKEAKRNWSVARDWWKSWINWLKQYWRAQKYLQMIWKTLGEIWATPNEVESFLESQSPFLLEQAIKTLPNLAWYVWKEIQDATVEHICFLLWKSGKSAEDFWLPISWEDDFRNTPRKSTWDLPRELLVIQTRKHLIHRWMLDVRTRIEDITEADIQTYLENREDFRIPAQVNHSWWE